ncbi:unnamed protein product, partial [Durusdinium trenchii]
QRPDVPLAARRRGRPRSALHRGGVARGSLHRAADLVEICEGPAQGGRVRT